MLDWVYTPEQSTQRSPVSSTDGFYGAMLDRQMRFEEKCGQYHHNIAFVG